MASILRLPDRGPPAEPSRARRWAAKLGGLGPDGHPPLERTALNPTPLACLLLALTGPLADEAAPMPVT